MLEAKRVKALFTEADAFNAEALERLDDAIKHWDRRELSRAAEKAWAAILQATNALVLAQTGVETKLDVHNDREIGSRLDCLQPKGPELKKLIGKYTDQWVHLFGLVLCDGNVDPIDATIEDIRSAADYIRDAERLAETHHA